MKTFLLSLKHAANRRKVKKCEQAIAVNMKKRKNLKAKGLKLSVIYEKTRKEVQKFINDNPL